MAAQLFPLRESGKRPWLDATLKALEQSQKLILE
jgi:hypothetical protein